MLEIEAFDQNSDIAIRSLAAQRSLYSQAKFLVGVQTILSIPVMAAVGSVVIYFDRSEDLDLGWLAAAIGAFVAAVNFALSRFAGIARTQAASIQEFFDCGVLSLPWNQILIRDRPTYQKIEGQSRRIVSDAKKKADLQNWYPKPPGVALNTDAWRLICQRTNIWWDAELRQKYSWYVGLAGCSLFGLLLVIGLLERLTLNEFFLLVIGPAIPAFVFAVTTISENRDAVRRLSDLKLAADSLWTRYKSSEIGNLLWECRALQDAIFVARSSNPLVPDWLYRIHRQSNETSASFSVVQMADELDRNLRE